MAANQEKKFDLSPNAIDKLGDRLRENTMEPGDLDLLDAYEAAYDPLLLKLSSEVESILLANKLSFCLSGRIKRPKSIIRKLRRDENKTMCLSQMGDIQGVRVLVHSIDDQNRALEVVKRNYKVHEIKDYRDSGEIYRSLHVLVRDERLLEIQIRTIPQHLWAVESESFGEKVKEGTLVGDEKAYLEDLSQACARLDRGEAVTEGDYAKTPLMAHRLPISGLGASLATKFNALNVAPGQTGTSFVVVYNYNEKKLLHLDRFAPAERQQAITLFQSNTRKLNKEEFESLAFNTGSAQVLEMTHPRFFI